MYSRAVSNLRAGYDGARTVNEMKIAHLLLQYCRKVETVTLH